MRPGFSDPGIALVVIQKATRLQPARCVVICQKNLEGSPLAAIVVSLVIGRQIARFRSKRRWLVCENSRGMVVLGVVLVLSTDISKCWLLVMVGKIVCSYARL
jgi:hypothetical protein